MFCIHCGTWLPDIARFCSGCGSSLGSTSQAGGGQPQPASPTPAFSPTSFAPNNTVPTPPVATPLLSPNGYPQPAFDRLAGAIFHALDQNVQPVRTGGLEVCKMKAYRILGGATVPPYYAEYVLPTYASIVGIELVPNQPRTAPVVSWNGWHHLLLQKILVEPEATFYHLMRLLTALKVPTTLTRADFPLAPDPNAQAKEARFRTEIYSLAQRGLGTGALGGGVGMLGGGALGGGALSGGGGNSISSAATPVMAQMMKQAGMNILNGSTGPGMGQWTFGGGAGC